AHRARGATRRAFLRRASRGVPPNQLSVNKNAADAWFVTTIGSGVHYLATAWSRAFRARWTAPAASRAWLLATARPDPRRSAAAVRVLRARLFGLVLAARRRLGLSLAGPASGVTAARALLRRLRAAARFDDRDGLVVVAGARILLGLALRQLALALRLEPLAA